MMISLTTTTPFSDDDQYLHETVNTILSLQPSLMVFIHQDILHHLHDDSSTVVHILLSLLMYLRNDVIRSSLLSSLQSKFLRSSPCVSKELNSMVISTYVSTISNCIFKEWGSTVISTCIFTK